MAMAMKRVEATTSISRERQPTLLPPPKSAHMPALHLRALQGWVGAWVGAWEGNRRVRAFFPPLHSVPTAFSNVASASLSFASVPIMSSALVSLSSAFLNKFFAAHDFGTPGTLVITALAVVACSGVSLLKRMA